MSDDNIIHFKSWNDFNDVSAMIDPADIEPDVEQLKIFLEVVFGYCEGLIPVRGFADKGAGKDGKPNNIWIEANDTALEKLATFTNWAWREGAAVYVVPGTVVNPGQAKAEHIDQMQTIVVDLDEGDIAAKYAHLVRYLGPPTLLVESGGRTAEGRQKCHVWWKLTEAAEGAHIDYVCRLRGTIAHKVGGDRHFRSAHQPIRVAGSVYHKGGFVRAVTILEHHPHIEWDLREFADRVSAMPLFPGVDSTADPEGMDKPSLRDVLTTPVHEGGVDQWTRFEGASAAIGHYIRLVHEGLLSPDDGWDGICQYNAAMLRPAWPLERLREEADRLWARHVSKYGPALLRAEARETASPASMTAYKLRALLADTSPMPEDIIAPRVLTPGGMLVLGGAPKVGKSDFLISLLVHMAAGVAFLGFTPARPLRIYYLQAEIQYHYLRERLQSIRLDPAIIEAALDNLAVTPKLRLLLDAEGIALAAASIQEHFPDSAPDIICFDPIRNLFDGGPEGGGENDNTAMMFFLTERIELLRESIAPDCGVILVHHTRKMNRKLVAEDPFQALSGASALRGFYTSGMLLHRPDEESSQRRLEIELRNGPALSAKLVDKIKGEWVELNPMNERLVRQEVGAKFDAERDRRGAVIMSILREEAEKGNLYTSTTFAEKFENLAGLGGQTNIRARINVLATKGYIKFLKGQAARKIGLVAARLRDGYLCVEGLLLATGEETTDPESGEVVPELIRILPSHFKCPQTGASLPVENPEAWVYQPEEEL